VEARTLAEGMLFALPAVGLKEQREERRRTIQERCEKIAELVDHDQAALIWCHLNDEGDLLEELVKDCVQVSGDDSDEEKEEKFIAFTTGEAKKLVTKQKIGAWGLNFQHCAHVAAFPSHSYEQHYQGVRRCWRFGQTKPVNVDIVMTEGERSVMENMQRKARQADKMFSHLVAEMNNSIAVEKSAKFTKTEEVPSWL
jgi:superfamily II DNA or RNA helicase